MITKQTLVLSIITPSYNSEKTISDTIESVLNQTYPNIEYIVIDGKSTDNTTQILKSYEIKFRKKNYKYDWISEPDKGIYDAMNKGIKLATGDIIGILNSDDFYKKNTVINRVVQEFVDKNVDSVFGDLEYVDKDNTSKVIRYWKSKPYQEKLFKKGWHPAHPTFFVKKIVYDKYGIFNLDFKIAADYELMLRFLEKYKVSSSYIPSVLVKMRMGGESNGTIKNIIKANIESYKAWKINKLHVSPLIFIKKPFSKLIQYLKKDKS